MKRVLCTLLVCCLLLSGCGKQKENQLISKEYSQQEQLDAESYVIGMEYYASAKYNEAIISFLKVSDESTLKSAAMVGLAECRIALGDTETAQTELAEYLQKVNGSGLLLWHYSRKCGRTGCTKGYRILQSGRPLFQYRGYASGLFASQPYL